MAKRSRKASTKSSILGALRLIRNVFGFFGKCVLTFFLVLAISGSIVATVLSLALLQLVDTGEIVDISPDNLSYTTIMYATDPDTGENMELQRIHGNENRIWVDYEQIPELLEQAVVAIEDKRFYEHGGVDWYRTAGAGINYFFHIWGNTQGGSTIHQQLIKNITGEDAVRVERKVQEIFQAINLDKAYSKDAIMESYLNTIHLGNNTNGVQAAANLYFGKDVSELTLAECACLASITQNPSKFDPSRNLENNKVRQTEVLENMFEQGYITEAEMNAAKNEPLNIVMNTASPVTNEEEPETVNAEATDDAVLDDGEEAEPEATADSSSGGYVYTSQYSYAEEYVIDQVINDLMEEYGWTKAKAQSEFYNGGLRIYTTIDTRAQAILEEIFMDYDTYFRPYISNNLPAQSAMAIIDTNGQIVALIGGTGTKDVDRGFNRATAAKRQPGSTMKPVGPYVLAMEYNIITYSSIYEDKPLSFSDSGTTWTPGNYYGGFDGRMTVDMAIRRSVNTVAIQVADRVGPVNIFNFLKNDLHVDSLIESKTIGNQIFSDIALSPMSLGSLSEGVTPLEWAGAYQMFSNGGYFTEPYSYTVVLDAAGNEVLRRDITATRVIAEDTAMVMNQLLQNVVYAERGTGSYASNLTGTRVAGKTGTSDNDYNQWFVGMTPNYVASLWIGYDLDKTVSYPGTYPPPAIWTSIMKRIQPLADNPSASFPTTDKVQTHRYCTISGELARDTCTSVAMGYYKSGNLPPLCTGHTFKTEDGDEVELDEDGNPIEKDEDEDDSGFVTVDPDEIDQSGGSSSDDDNRPPSSTEPPEESSDFVDNESSDERRLF